MLIVLMYLYTKLTYTCNYHHSLSTSIYSCMYIFPIFRNNFPEKKACLKKNRHFEDFRKFAEDDFVLPKS